MKINKTLKRETGGNQIVLVRKEAKQNKLVSDPAEQSYIRKAIEAKEALEASRTTTVQMPGRGPRGSRPKKPKGPMRFKKG